MKRLISCLLLLSLLLCGCSVVKEPNSAVLPQDEPPETTASTVPVQMTMPQEDLVDAVQRAEYSMLAAAFLRGQQVQQSLGYLPDTMRGVTYLGDLDGDGSLEFIWGDTLMEQDEYGAPRLYYAFTESGSTLFLDKDGNFYRQIPYGSGPIYEENGQYVEEYGWEENYWGWTGQQWESRFSCSGFTVARWDMDADFSTAQTEKTFQANVPGQSITTEDEFNSYLEQLGMTQIQATLDSYVAATYDAAYTESLIPALEARLQQNYHDSYGGCHYRDLDGDGQTEYLFMVGNIFTPWLDSLYQTDEYPDATIGALQHTWLTQEAAVLLIADPRGDQLVLSAISSSSLLGNWTSVTEFSSCLLTIGGISYYLPGSFESLADLSDADRLLVIEALQTYLGTMDFSGAMLKLADISDLPGDEILCLAQKDGVWHIIVLVFRQGMPVMLQSQPLNGSSCYLVEKDGKLCLLTYYQNIYGSGQDTWTAYSYELCRFNDTGFREILESNYITVSSQEQDASGLAAFFEQFNRYIIHVIVLYDPYGFQSQVWMTPDAGQTPQEAAPENTDSTLGFVQISDPSSWLNLRVGPGTEYDRVLTDPSDPESYIRQALGAPVTILETIKTGDAENPVWLRVRIRYADQEYEGYCSQRYIRMV